MEKGNDVKVIGFGIEMVPDSDIVGVYPVLLDTECKVELVEEPYVTFRYGRHTKQEVIDMIKDLDEDFDGFEKTLYWRKEIMGRFERFLTHEKEKLKAWSILKQSV